MEFGFIELYIETQVENAVKESAFVGDHCNGAQFEFRG